MPERKMPMLTNIVFTHYGKRIICPNINCTNGKHDEADE